MTAEEKGYLFLIMALAFLMLCCGSVIYAVTRSFRERATRKRHNEEYELTPPPVGFRKAELPDALIDEWNQVRDSFTCLGIRVFHANYRLKHVRNVWCRDGTSHSTWVFDLWDELRDDPQHCTIICCTFDAAHATVRISRGNPLIGRIYVNACDRELRSVNPADLGDEFVACIRENDGLDEYLLSGRIQVGRCASLVPLHERSEYCDFVESLFRIAANAASRHSSN